MLEMRPIAINVPVAWCAPGPCKNGLTRRRPGRGVETLGGPRNIGSDGGPERKEIAEITAVLTYLHSPDGATFDAAVATLL